MKVFNDSVTIGLSLSFIAKNNRFVKVLIEKYKDAIIYD